MFRNRCALFRYNKLQTKTELNLNTLGNGHIKGVFKSKRNYGFVGLWFDPGQSQIYVACIETSFDEIHYLDILDCNVGDHGQAFATNFNPEINIREITKMENIGKTAKCRKYHSLCVYPQTN